MTTVFRLTGADFSGKGLPNLFPFVAKADLEYAFDFRNRATRLIDLVGKHVITPKRNDPSAAIVNVTDQTIITTADNGLGITVGMGYLQCNLPVTAIPTGGAKQFTIMVVGGYSGVAFPAGKIVASGPETANLYDYGSLVSSVGIAIDASWTRPTIFPRIEYSQDSFYPSSPMLASATQKTVSFLSFDGTNWNFYGKTQGTKLTGTNTSLSVANPVEVTGLNWTGGMVSLGGLSHRSSTLHGSAPSLYQHAMWNRVLTDAEVEAQYQQTKMNFAALGV